MTTKKIEVKEEKDIKVEAKIDSTNELLLNKIIELEKRLTAGESKPVEQVKKETKSTKRNPLIDKKIIIEPINKGVSPTVPFDKAQATMLLGTNRSIICPLDKLGRIADPLEDWEREYLEELTGLDLDIYSEKCFYKKATIKFKRRGKNLDSASTVLDLKDPFQYILYKIALIAPDVANKWEDRNNIRYSYVVRDNEAQLAEDLLYTDKADDVLSYLLSNKKNKKSLFNLIRLYGNNDTLPVKVDYNKSVDWLYQQLRKISDTKKGIRVLYQIITENESSPTKLNTKVLIEDGVTCGALIKAGKKYTNKGGDAIGYDINEACSYLENPENRDFKLWVSTEIDKYFKDK